MRVFVQVKSAGKRRAALEKRAYELPEGIVTLKDLIAAVVDTEVSAYNSKRMDTVVTHFLTEEELEGDARRGKIGFGRMASGQKADCEKARAAALQAYEDGLFRVFVNGDEQSSLEAEAAVSEGDTLTFVRLAFLSGRLW